VVWDDEEEEEEGGKVGEEWVDIGDGAECSRGSGDGVMMRRTGVNVLSTPVNKAFWSRFSVK